ncbi:protein IRX15-LIKE-like [Rutidosis leptorrhynchoides]|uniref:protein IRX15-LIKE-like n=1 Tax=Rutidosis leptorrhynchoides TaxID=125765 RepID=UPI003A9A1E1E
MKPNNTKFILLHPSIPTPNSHHRFYLLTFLTLLSISLTFFLITLSTTTTTSGATTAAAVPHSTIFNILLHYASTPTPQSHLSLPQLTSITTTLQKHPFPSNFNLLVFGITHETLLFHALNFNGRTTFIDESAYTISKLEEKNFGVEAYDVQFVTKVSELHDLIRYAKTELRKECRPVQNLLFSECKLGINDLPNFVYDVAWDVILIDGPRGYFPDAPGRLSAIFTASVLARSKKGGGGETHVFVHEFDREVERVGSDEFLCRENLVETVGNLGHFVVKKMDYGGVDGFRFCRNLSSSAALATARLVT